ncbi:MAG TPA: GNAT family protein [Chitinophagales bacterium]|nr:GNAT family protein [Chitinophagales bacterium]
MTKLPKKIIETERLLLQPYHINLYKEVYVLIQKNKARLTHSFPNMLKATQTMENTKDYVQQKSFDWNNNKAFAYLLIDKNSQALIGHFNIKDIDWKKKEAELAYFIDIDYEKKGLITEAMQLIIRLCFTYLPFEHIFARIVIDNLSSQKVVEKSGLKYEGAFYNAYTTYDNMTVDTYRYGISKNDYIKMKA